MSALRVSPPCASTVLLLTVLLLSARAGRAEQPANTTYYAAIAFSKATGKYGYSSGFLSKVNANREALKNCKANDASVVLVVGNGYAALALGDDKSAYGYGYAEKSADEAKRHALEGCRKRTTNCKIVVWVHSWAG